MKTPSAKKEEVDHKWFVVDATDKSLGRLSVNISNVLQGKHKPIYTPHVDTGDFVVVLNCGKVSVSRRNLTQKIYYRHTGHPGGMKEETLEEKLEKRPDQVIRLAVRGMLPKTKLGRKMIKKLKLYSGSEHPHEAQQPQELELSL